MELIVRRIEMNTQKTHLCIFYECWSQVFEVKRNSFLDRLFSAWGPFFWQFWGNKWTRSVLMFLWQEVSGISFTSFSAEHFFIIFPLFYHTFHYVSYLYYTSNISHISYIPLSYHTPEDTWCLREACNSGKTMVQWKYECQLLCHPGSGFSEERYFHVLKTGSKNGSEAVKSGFHFQRSLIWSTDIFEYIQSEQWEEKIISWSLHPEKLLENLTERLWRGDE